MSDDYGYGAAPASHDPGTKHEKPDPENQDDAAQHGPHGDKTLTSGDTGSPSGDAENPHAGDPDASLERNR